MEKKEKKSLLGRTKHKWVALGLAGTIAASALIPAVSQAWTPRSVIEIHNSIVAQNQHYGETLHGYRVQYGDTVWGLSKATGESVGSIARTYGISNPSRIYAGQVLRRVGDIQDSVSNEDAYYTVQWGDTLYNISRAFGTTVDQLVKWNNIANRNLIYVGDRLQVRPIGEQVETPVEKPAPEVPVEEVPTPEVPVEDDPTLGPVPEVPQQPETPEEPEAPEEEPEEVPVVPEDKPEVPVVPEEPAPEDEDENYDPPITVKQRISYEPIPYEVERVENPELDEGEERVVQEGVAGERKFVWEQTIKGDILTNESLEYSEVVKEPITKIIEFGIADVETVRTEEHSWFVITPLPSIRRENPDLPIGEVRVVQEGVHQKVKVTYLHTFENDRMVDSELIKEEIIIEGVPEIFEVGTYGVPEITTQTDTYREEIPYKINRVPNPNMDKGTENVISEGKFGEVERSYKVTYEVTPNGSELISSELIEEKILSEPVDAVVEYGTKEAPVITKEWHTVHEDIGYTTQYVENPELEEGVENVIQEGIIGVREVVYVHTYEDGEFVEKTLSSSNVTLEPRVKIIEVGTAIPVDDKYVLLTDEDFSRFNKYIGDAEYVIIPHTVNGTTAFDSGEMFGGTSIKGVIAQENAITNGLRLFSSVDTDSLELNQFNTSAIKSMNSMFRWSDIGHLDIRNFDTSNVTDMNNMFSYSNISEIRHDDIDTSNVTSMSSMFNFVTTFNQDFLNVLDTENVENMGHMFGGSDVAGLDFSWLDTSSVTNMSMMFSQTREGVLDLSMVTIPEHANIDQMFENSSLDTVYVKDAATAKRLADELDKNIAAIEATGRTYTRDVVNFVVK